MIGGRFSLAKSGMKRLTRRATSPTCPSCCSTLTRNRQGSPSTSTTWAKSAPPVSSKIFAAMVVEHRQAEPDHFVVVDRPAIHRPQRAVDADIGRAADLQVQIAAFQLHHGAEQLVDFQLLPLAAMKQFFDIRRRPWRCR